jgi:hypothetical protein
MVHYPWRDWWAAAYIALVGGAFVGALWLGGMIK